jgi:tRNA A37 methylthiotransferase MiaB
VRRKLYLIQPTYRNPKGELHQGTKLAYCSLALPALSATIPPDWEKEFCIEYYENVNYESDASVVGISSMGYDLLHGMEIAAEFKRRGKKVLFGGTQAAISADRLTGLCDAVVSGNPGPRDLQSILDDATNGNIQSVYNVGMHVNFSFDYSVFEGRVMRFVSVLSSVGCRNACSFCSTASLYGGSYRLRSLEYVIADLHSARRYGRDIVFGDSNIFNNREYLARLCARIIKEKLHIRWGAQCTVDIGDDEELLSLLHQSGCLVLLVGLETLSQANMLGVEKEYSVDLHKERINRIRAAGIEVGGYFILGMENDGPQSFNELYEFIAETGIALPVLNILLPAPGTSLYEQLKREGRLLVNDDVEFLKNNARYATASSHCFYVPKQMSVQETEEGFLHLYERLTRWPVILRRSLRPNLHASLVLLMMNAEMRSEYSAMRRPSTALAG